jgi:hypothetical protein
MLPRYLQAQKIVKYLSNEGFEPDSSLNHLTHIYQLKYLPTIGTRLPTPNALEEIRMMGQNWLRLYSFTFTIFSILSTKVGSKPIDFISGIKCDQGWHSLASYHYLFGRAAILH